MRPFPLPLIEDTAVLMMMSVCSTRAMLIVWSCCQEWINNRAESVENKGLSGIELFSRLLSWKCQCREIFIFIVRGLV